MFSLSYLTEDFKLTKIAIENSQNFSELNKFDDKNAGIEEIAVNCKNNNIYILKSMKEGKVF